MHTEIVTFADRLLVAIDLNQPFEFVTAFASLLPSLVIASMLGIEDAQVEHFRT